MPAASSTFDYEAALADCAKGDRAALHRIYQHESRRLLGVALRIVRDRARAEDVLHDAFMNLWTKAASFDATRGEGRGWIHSIVRNQALSAVRSSGREVSADEDAIEAIEAEAVANAAVSGPRLLDSGHVGACVVKHTNPCGASIAPTCLQAVDAAIAAVVTLSSTASAWDRCYESANEYRPSRYCEPVRHCEVYKVSTCEINRCCHQKVGYDHQYCSKCNQRCDFDYWKNNIKQ